MHPIENLRYVARAQGVPAVDLVRETAHALSWLGATGPDLIIACRRIVERQPAVGQLWWLAASLLATADTRAIDDVVDELVEAIEGDSTARRLADALPADATVVTIGRPDVIGDAVVRRGDVQVLCADSQHDASSFLRRLELSGVACEPLPGEYLARAVATADVVVVEALALSDSRVVAPVGSHVLAAVAAQIGRPVWVVAPLGTRLPHQYVDAIVATCSHAARNTRNSSAGQIWQVDTDVFPVTLASCLVTGDGVMTVDSPAIRTADCPFLPELLKRSAF